VATGGGFWVAAGDDGLAPCASIAPNRLDRQFDVAPTDVLNQVWVGDITYLPTRDGWLYLAVVLDLASRRVIGWAMRHTLAGELTRDALTMALTSRRPKPGGLYHSDRGSQYAAGDFQARLTDHAMACSMSGGGDCWDNAVAERFFATLKRELADRADWHTRDEARTTVFEYIEVWYNQQRRHSSLGYLSPVEYDQQLASAQAITKAA
jgi:putative transposase